MIPDDDLAEAEQRFAALLAAEPPALDHEAVAAADIVLRQLHQHEAFGLSAADAFAAALAGNCGDFPNLGTLTRAGRLNLRALQSKLEALGRSLFAAELERDRMQIRWVQRAIAVALATEAPAAAVRAVLDRLPKVWRDDEAPPDPIIPRRRHEVRGGSWYGRQADELSRSTPSVFDRARAAERAAAAPEPGPGRVDPRPPRTAAVALLREALADGRTLDVVDLVERSRAEGIRWRTMERAKEALGVQAERKGGLGKAGKWVWRLPADADAKAPPDFVDTQSIL